MSEPAIVYVVCYDDTSEAFARASIASTHDWARIVRIESTPYLENVMYFDVLESLRDEWKDCRHVGAISWRAAEKIKLPKTWHVHSSDVISLHSGIEGRLVEDGSRCHPGFGNVWFPLLQSLGYTREQAMCRRVRPMYCNYWLAKPQWMDRYLEFMKRAKTAMDELPEIQEALWSDARYASSVSPERRMEVFGRPHYTHHPFVCERLAGFFFKTEGASIDFV